jgi:hypothetical protein
MIFSGARAAVRIALTPATRPAAAGDGVSGTVPEFAICKTSNASTGWRAARLAQGRDLDGRILSRIEHGDRDSRRATRPTTYRTIRR